jgi:hypothetical protein
MSQTTAHRTAPEGSSPVRVALVSHRGGNIGHDIMAWGVEECVREAFRDTPLEIEHLEHHQPFAVHPRSSPLRLLNRFPHGQALRLKRAATSPAISSLLWRHLDRRLTRFDVAIVCGGPAIHPGAGTSPDMRAMYQHMLGALSSLGIPVLNLSVGSCYPCEKRPLGIPSAADAAFYQRTLELCSVTTVRDQLAKELTERQGAEAMLIACPAIVSGRLFERIAPESPDHHVVLNLQPDGANEDWGQGVDPDEWRRTAREVVELLKQRHRLLFVCHGASEAAFCRELDPTIDLVVPQTQAEYARIASGADGGLTTRIHAAIALAGVGTAPVVVGTDSRLETVQQMGLETVYVKDARADELAEAVEHQIADRQQEHKRLVDLRERTAVSYAGLIREAVAGRNRA